jgi:chemotaxis regulatin CheY-phosphate phosphatase CheZ
MSAASDNITSADMMAEDATHIIMDNVEHITVELDKLIVDQPDGDMKEALQDLAGKAAEINMALQFQDITSQHLRQAMQIVEAIQVRMEKLFESLKSIGEKNELVKKIVESYTEGADEEAIDITDTVRKEAAISQDDIDALFGT